MGYIIGVVILIMALFLFYFYGYRKSNDPQVDDEVVEPQKDSIDAKLQSLLNFNIVLRDEGLSDDVTTKTEMVIDLVRDLIEPVNLNHISEMTPIVNRLASHYLPNLIVPFVKLSDTDKVSATQIILEKLDNITVTLLEVRESLDNNNNMAFTKQAEVISAMFNESVTDNL